MNNPQPSFSVDYVRVSREAHALEHQHGRDAYLFAQRLAKEAETEGDIEAAALWRAVYSALAPR